MAAVAAAPEALYRRLLTDSQQQLGAHHPDTLLSANDLTGLLHAQGKLAEAEPLCRRALEGRERQLGAQHTDTLAAVNNLAMLLNAQGNLVDDWSVRSSSGFDYSRSFVSQVPVPSSWVLFAAGSLLLLRRLRTRQTH
jgi:hypothetical protein